MRALLDVNVLIALLDEAHVLHVAAARWLTANINNGWASCPMTQNGCIRIMAHSTYPNRRAVVQVVESLSAATQTPYHQFWPDDVETVSATDLDWRLLLTSKHLTDVYLLAIATRRNARFVSFDRQIPATVVSSSATKNLLVIG